MRKRGLLLALSLSGLFLSSCSIAGKDISLNLNKDKTAYKGYDALKKHLNASYGDSVYMKRVTCYKYSIDEFNYWYNVYFEEYSSGHMSPHTNTYGYSVTYDAVSYQLDETNYGIARAKGKLIKINI